MRTVFIENIQNGLDCINILPKNAYNYILYTDPRYTDSFSTTDSEQLRMVIALFVRVSSIQ